MPSGEAPPASVPSPADPDPQPARTQADAEAGRDWLAIEKELIVNTLTQTRGNRSKAAALLGWGRTTLWRKLKSHGLVTGSNGASK